MTIVEFLEARIAEDEAIAQTALAWALREKVTWDAENITPYEVDREAPNQAGRWSPRRTLAECAAKRAIIEDWEDPSGPGVWEGYDAGSALATDKAVRALAAVFKDHPDYNEEWSV